jgi:hypothetical protein
LLEAFRRRTEATHHPPSGTTVIHFLEAVDVDKGDHELGAGAMCALELVRNLCETERPRPRTGQLISRRDRQRVGSFLAAVTRRSTFSSCFRPVLRRVLTVVGGFGPIGRGAGPISLRPQNNILIAAADVIVEIMQTRQRITAPRRQDREVPPLDLGPLSVLKDVGIELAGEPEMHEIHNIIKR